MSQGRPTTLQGGEKPFSSEFPLFSLILSIWVIYMKPSPAFEGKGERWILLPGILAQQEMCLCPKIPPHSLESVKCPEGGEVMYLGGKRKREGEGERERGRERGGKREKGKRERKKESERDTQEPPFLGRLSLSEFPRLAISEKPP